MIIYAGKESKIGFVKEVIDKEELIILPEALDFYQQLGEVLLKAPDYAIYDLEQYHLSPEELTDELIRVSKSIKTKHIFLSDHFSPHSKLITSLYDAGFSRFIFGVTLTDQKEELKRALTDYYEVNPNEELVAAHEKMIEKENLNLLKKRIGVCGSIPRMGVTTFCIQLVKYFIYQGYQACFVGIYQTEDIQLLKKYYDVIGEDDELGYFQLENVDFYYREDKLEEVLDKPYDFFVYDYGCYQGKDFNRQSFLEKDQKMICLGYTPKEIEATRKVLEQVTYRNIKYIYNFTSPKDEKEILDLMGELKQDTYFLGYIPDAYELTHVELFENLFPVENRVKPLTLKERLFSRKKRR